MRQIRWLFSFFLLLSNSLLAQTNFLKVYTTLGYQDPNSLIQTSTGGYFSVGEGQIVPGEGLFIYVLKTDQYGNRIWEKFLQTGFVDLLTSQILKTTTGYAILSFNSGMVITVIDEDGLILSTKFVADSLGGKSMDNSKDKKGLIIAAEIDRLGNQKNDIVLLKTDLEGNTLWRRQYGSPLVDERPTRIYQLEDGGYMVLGSTYELSPHGYDDQTLVFRTDSLGEVIWKKIITGPNQNHPIDFTRTKDGNYVIFVFKNSVPSLLGAYKINPEGEVLWSKDINTPIRTGIRAFTETKEGNFIVVGETLIPTDQEDHRHSSVTGVSADGDYLWQKIYEISPLYSSAFRIMNTNDGNYLIGGRTGVTQDVDVYLQKIGSDGCQMEPPNIGGDSVLCSKQVELVAKGGFDSYKWNTGSTDSTISVNITGTYSVRVTRKDNCARTDSVQITLKNCLVYDHCRNVAYETDELQIPNVVTPNDDPLNQFFEVPEMLKGSRLDIVNRWGALVYQSNDYQNTWSGSELTMGVYFFILSNACFDGTIKGPLSIVK